MTLDDVVAAGLTARYARHMVDKGEWRRAYRGVFIDNAVPITPMQTVIAASRAIGGRGLASHRLGAWLRRIWWRTHSSTACFIASCSRRRGSVVFGTFGEYRLDFYWPEAGLVVEVDGWSIHAAPGARRNDFAKQNRIVISDRWVLRYDWFQVEHQPVQTAAEVLEAYRARASLVV